MTPRIELMGESRDAWTSSNREGRSRRSVIVWSAGWVVAFLIADFAIDNGWLGEQVWVVAVTVATALIGLGWVAAYLSFLRHADELMRRIQLEAMAAAVGGGFIAGFALILLRAGGTVDARISHVLVAMTATYVIALIVGLRRFT